VADLAPWQVGRQRLAFGLLLVPGAGAAASAQLLDLVPPPPDRLSISSSSRLRCSALKRSDWAANFMRLSSAFS
jgi:hypothetical protein